MLRMLAIYLVLSLLVCPLVCAGGPASNCAGSKGSGRTCDCCEHESQAGRGQSDPSQLPPVPRGDTCQCICGGAIAGDAGANDVAFDWSWSQPVVVIEPAVARLREESQSWFATAPWPDVGMNHGRALCYQFSTMQC